MRSGAKRFTFAGRASIRKQSASRGEVPQGGPEKEGAGGKPGGVSARKGGGDKTYEFTRRQRGGPQTSLAKEAVEGRGRRRSYHETPRVCWTH